MTYAASGFMGAFFASTLGQLHNVKISSGAQSKSGPGGPEFLNSFLGTGSGQMPNAATDSVFADKDLSVIPGLAKMHEQLTGKQGGSDFNSISPAQNPAFDREALARINNNAMLNAQKQAAAMSK